MATVDNSLLGRLGFRSGTLGSSASLAIAAPLAEGNYDASSQSDAARIGWYFDRTVGAEKLGCIVGGQTGPLLTRSGTSVNLVVNGSVSTSSLGTNQNIVYTGASGLLQTAAGFTVTNTPSATAPSTGTNGPGLNSGIVIQAPNGDGTSIGLVSFGNGASKTIGYYNFACQGTSTSPGATIQNDTVQFTLRGHNGTNYTGGSATINFTAGSNWTSSNYESYMLFGTCANGATGPTNAGRIDSNQRLVWGGNGSASVGNYTGGTVRPRIQAFDTTAPNASITATSWNGGVAGPSFILGKSRSTTIGTPGVITTGDTLGTLSFQGDDGTNFVEAARIFGVSTGTIGTGQVPGMLRFLTANSTGTMTTAAQFDASQNLSIGNNNNVVPTVFTAGAITPRVYVNGGGGSISSIAMGSFQVGTGAASLYFGKSRGGAPGTMTIVTTGDTLGTIDWQGADGTNFVSAAQIVVTATGTVGAGQIPGNMVIKTANSAGTMTSALTIDSTQVVTLSANITSVSPSTGTLVISGTGGIGVGGVIQAGSNIASGAVIYTAGNFMVYAAKTAALNTANPTWYRTGNGGSAPFDVIGNTVFEGSNTAGAYTAWMTGTTPTFAMKLDGSQQLTLPSTTATHTISSTVVSASAGTGALVVAGGVGIGGVIRATGAIVTAGSMLAGGQFQCTGAQVAFPTTSTVCYLYRSGGTITPAAGDMVIQSDPTGTRDFIFASGGTPAIVARIDGKGAIVPQVKAGTPTDADMNTPVSGGIIIDSTASKIWVRIGSTWKSVAVA